MRIFPTPTESNGVLESKGCELNIVGEERCLLSFEIQKVVVLRFCRRSFQSGYGGMQRG